VVAVSSKAEATMEVSFPASANFDQIANVAASNIAFRLKFKMKTVARIRKGVDATTELLGIKGITHLVADWSKGPLKLTFSNAKAKLDSETMADLKDLFTELGATGVSVKANSVTFAIAP
jgi:hypothetical protein